MNAHRDVHAGHGFDFLEYAVLVVTLGGDVLEANASARSFFGSRLSAGRLETVLAEPDNAYLKYLRLAGSSTSPRPGKMRFCGENGHQELRTQAARSRRSVGEVEVILRLMPASADRFVALDRKVNELDRQLHKRVQENVNLQEVLRKNRTFVKELQHRVKNNIQLILSLMQRAGLRHTSPEVEAVVKTMRGRLYAIAAAQEALYQAAEADIVPARAFLEDVVRTIARANGASEAIDVSCDDARLSTEEAQCLALIANELITNAAKFGLRDGQGRICVTFVKDGSCHRFEVTDQGAGIETQKVTRYSGLELARGLSHQIGGRLEIDGSQGTTCRVRFPAVHQ